MGLEQKITGLVLRAGRLPGYKKHPFETYQELSRSYGISGIKHPKDLFDKDITLLNLAAKKAIGKYKRSLTTKGFLTGIPGGFSGIVAGTAIDMEEYLRTMFLLSQELGQIYGLIPNPFSADVSENINNYFEEVNEEILKALLIGLGAGTSGMFIVNAAKKYGEKKANDILRERVTEHTLVKLAEKIGTTFGLKVAKTDVAKLVAKGVPLIGGVLNASLNYKSVDVAGENLVNNFRKEHLAIRPKIIEYWSSI